MAPGEPGRRQSLWIPATVLVTLAIIVAATLVLLGPAPVACGSGGATRSMALRFLIVAPRAPDDAAAYWRDILGRAGVPHDVLRPSMRAPLTPAALTRGPVGRYQAIVIAGSALDEMAPAERAALVDYERRFGVRRVSAFPSGGTAVALGLRGAAPLDGVVARLTADGREAFANLRGPVPIERARVRRGSVARQARVRILLSAGRAPLMLSIRHDDGREELVDMVKQNPMRLHSQLLARDLIGWASRGVHLGVWHSYLAVQVDDVLLANLRWDADRDSISDRRRVIMTAADLARAASWSRDRGIRLDLGINASGATSPARDCTPLGRAIIARRAQFGFFNHTYNHLNLDEEDAATITGEILRNVTWAQSNDIPLDPGVLVTGEHSGLANPRLPTALRRTGVRWLATDASAKTAPSRLGYATTVARHPSNIYYDAATRAELLDEYNHRNHDGCRAPRECLPRPATWAEFLRDESRRLLALVLYNDPRPLFVHQSNLAAEGTLYPILDRVLRAYRTTVRAPLLQPTLDESGRALGRQRHWREGQADVVAWRAADRLFLRARRRLDIPVTGLVTDPRRRGGQANWIAVNPDTTKILRIIR